MKRLLLLCFIGLLSSSLLSFQDDTPAPVLVHFQEGDWQSVLDSANANKKVVLIVCTASWCLPCKQMEKYTYTDAHLADYLKQNAIVYKWHAEDFDHITLLQNYKVEKYPSLLLLNSKGKELNRIVGFQSAKELESFIDKTLHPVIKKVKPTTATPKNGTKKK